MLGSLLEEGYVVSDDPAASRIIIVNTCCFIEDAKKESIDTILEMSEHKRSGACELLVVAGCLPQRYRDELAESMPEVDLFIGVGEIPRLPDLIRKHASEQGGTQRLEVSSACYLYDHTVARTITGRPHAAYIKIAEGCFHACSFCVIPRIRGKFQSRAIDSIVREAEELVARGIKELNLIAQDSTAYGCDLGDGADLGALLERLAAINGEKWIRVLYSYPHAFPDSVIAAMRDYPDVVSYLDVPVQHISDRILASMRREGGGDEVRRLVQKLRQELPDIALRTSVIVGYPGETEDEFQELLDFICEVKFDNLGAFVYSQEEGTAAAKLDKQVPRVIAHHRVDELMRLQKEISRDLNILKVGRVVRALMEGRSEETEHLLVARHAGQAPDVDGVIYINEGTAPTGSFADVEIVEAHDYDLVGRVV
jgi:ribosomal protein S12 methylthiotransferase